MIRFGGKIPVSIHPLFWLLAAFIGWISSHSLAGTIVWIGIILVSVLVHEFGHALTAYSFGKKPQVALVALGGLTSYDPSNLKGWKQFIIVMNGPLAGIALAFLATGIMALGVFTSPFILLVLKITQLVNFFWSFINLIPILPLDGGQLLRIVLESIWGAKGVKASLFIGMVVAFAGAIGFIMFGNFLLGAFFFLFAFQSFEMWRRSKALSNTDQQEDLIKELKAGEEALMQGNKSLAMDHFEKIKERAHEGLIYTTAVHYLGILYYEEGKRKEAYQIFKEIKDKLADDTLIMLQELAFEEKNYPLVVEISSRCYQASPKEEVALRNAKAFAMENNPRHAGGWLQTALVKGRIKYEQIISDTSFDSVREDPEFKAFLKGFQR